MTTLQRPLRQVARQAKYRANQQVERLRPGKPRETIHDYWTSPDPADAGNQPEHYRDPEHGTARSEYVVDTVRPYLTPEASVLEVGCNVGRNLNQFWQAGFHNVNGVEINPHAVELLHETYPDMSSTATIRQGRAEEILPGLPDQAFDVVFTLAVLVHIHPDSESIVFPEIARVARKAIVTVEDEGHRSWRHFKRNYRQVFEPLGWRQVHQEDPPPNIGIPDNFVIRIFEPR